jgi:hypothetical protein
MINWKEEQEDIDLQIALQLSKQEYEDNARKRKNENIEEEPVIIKKIHSQETYAKEEAERLYYFNCIQNNNPISRSCTNCIVDCIGDSIAPL